MDLHGDALNKIVGDMDDMESKRMFPADGGGATITISIAPGHAEPDGDEGLPADHDASMCGGGCALHAGGIAASTAEKLPADKGMAAGGEVPSLPVPAEVDDTRVPPFLRKKRSV